ncbi:MAG: ATP-dependent Clp protease adaptor ClpS [Deltaproteobacteria bacterium]|nr:ATP-dependent Clp protease adaptor ClpS [Deltaproteobacteria bacterium]
MPYGLIEGHVPNAGHGNASDPPTAVFFYTSRRFPPIKLGDEPQGESPNGEEIYEVRIIDNDYNTYQEVMDIAKTALEVTEEQAYAIAWEVDHKGSCVVAEGPRPEAENIAGVIRIIGIEVQVNLVRGAAR